MMTEMSYFVVVVVVVVRMKFITCLVLLKGIEQWVVQLWPFKSPLISIHSCPHPSLLSRIQPHIYQLAFSATKASGFRVCDIKASEQRPNHVNIHNQTLHSFD